MIMRHIKIRPPKKGVPIHVQVNNTRVKPTPPQIKPNPPIEKIQERVQENIDEPQIDRKEATPDNIPFKKKEKRRGKRKRTTESTPYKYDQ